jgi:hypothetical protein
MFEREKLIRPLERGTSLSIHAKIHTGPSSASNLQKRYQFEYLSTVINNRFYSVEVSQALVARLTRVRFTVGPHRFWFREGISFCFLSNTNFRPLGSPLCHSDLAARVARHAFCFQT